MNKKDHKNIIITSIICLLPMILSLILYNRLPDEVAVHWNSEGIADGYMHKALAAFGLPVLFFIINLISKTFLLNDPKKERQSQVIKTISMWIAPVLSVVLVPVTLYIALGVNIPIVMISSLVAGVLLIILGNYLPKSRQNYTIGIKLPWTLNDEDNWNKTHRMAGFLWVCGGIILIVSNFFLSETYLYIPVIIVILVLVPVVYSYLLYKNTDKEKLK